VLEFLGHEVLRLNHVGDWGTQFGMLIQFLKERAAADSAQGESKAIGSINNPLDVGAAQIGDLMELYKAAKRRFDEDAAFRERAREEVVRLQGGDADSLRVWTAICEKSRLAFQELYDALGVRITERGESFYNPMLPGLVDQLRRDGVAVESEGALCVFLDEYKNTDGTPLPLVCYSFDIDRAIQYTFLYLPLRYMTTDCTEVGRRISVCNDGSGSHRAPRCDGAGGPDRLRDGRGAGPALLHGLQGRSQGGTAPATAGPSRCAGQ
jgi:arginyl-tRNA synthetase